MTENTAALFTFGTMNTEYAVFALGFGLLEVKRAPKGDVDAFRGLSVEKGFLADEVICVPTEPEGSVLRDRKVAFRKDGRTIAVTSYADSRAYCELPWGSYEDGLIRRYASA